MLCRWGIVHTEKFWRENAKLLEGNDFEMLKVLISLLVSDSPVSDVSTLWCDFYFFV